MSRYFSHSINIKSHMRNRSEEGQVLYMPKQAKFNVIFNLKVNKAQYCTGQESTI